MIEINRGFSIKLKYLLLTTGIVFCFSLYSTAQNTIIQEDEEIELFKKGMELLVREKYAASKEFFEQYINQTRYENRTDNLRIADARYYVAYCALQLFNPDAELLFNQFLATYPEHSKASLANYELGNFFYNAKKYQKTIEYLEKAEISKLSKEQKLEAQFKLGYAYFSQKEFDKAAELFNKIKNENHKYTYAANYYAGYLALKQGNNEEAINSLLKAEQNEAYASVVPYLLANVYYQQGDYEKLIPYTEAALQRKDIQEKEELYLLLAESHFRKENYAKAAEFFENYAKKSRLSAPVQYRLGYAQYMSGKYPEAVQNLKPIAGSKDALGQLASYYLGLSYLKTGNKQFAMAAFQQAGKAEFSKQIQEEAILNYAKVNADLENYNETITALKFFNRNFPKSQHAQEADELLGEAFLKTSNYTEALNYIESLKNRSLRLNTAYQRIAYFKGVEEFNNKNFQSAIELFNKSTEFPIDKDVFLGTHFWKGEAYSILKDYDQAINSYAKVFQNAHFSNDFHIRSRYGIGYAYYYTEKYDKALEHFREYVKAMESAKNKRFYDDALLRLADLYAFNRNYNEALNNYNKAIESRNPDLDYAQFRRGLVLSLQQKNEEAIEAFSKVTDFYPSSLYFDDALFRKAELIFSQGNFDKSLELFTQLITQHSNSEYLPYAYNFRAIGYSNLDKYNEAIEDFRKVIYEYPNHPIAAEALAGLQEALNKADRSDEFAAAREEFVKNNPDSKSLVNIDYEAAKSLYNNQKYDRAVEALQSYLNKYPESPNNADAKYFLAESYNKAGKPEKAIETFKTVISEGKSDYLSRAVIRLADLYFSQGDYQNAKQYYKLLLNTTNNAKERSIAWAALMETYFKLDKYDSVQYFAEQILQHSKFSMDANKATLFLGKVAYKQGNMEKAVDNFLTTINLAKDENAAEAKYMIAKIYYDQKKYKQSLETLYELNNTFYNYDKWLAKSFLLIANNFIAMDEIFQAKATLQSIIDKSTHRESVEEAKKKLAELEKPQEGIINE